MATIEYSVPVESMSGRIGNSQMVMFKSHGRNFVRMFTKPSGAASPDQASIRAFLGAAAKQWAALTAAQRESWKQYAETFFSHERNGQTFVPAGSQLYNKIAYFRQAQGLALPTAAPSFGPPPGLSSFAQAADTDDDQFVYTVHHAITTVTNYKLLARITAPVGPGVTPQEQDLRYIKGVAAGSFLALPANSANADWSGARFSIPSGGAYRVELTVLSPESVPSIASGALLLHEIA